jgi:putative hydrolase of the HAD superfamily
MGSGIKVVAFDFGHTLLDEEVDNHLELHRRAAVPMPGALEALSSIKIPMAVWANTRDATASDIRKRLDRAGFQRYFQWIVTSFDVGWRKPDPKFFAAALATCECNPGEVLFVGNQRNSDIRGANNCGILSVLLTGSAYRSKDDTGDSCAEPAYRIEHLRELPALVQRLTEH